ncbi:hypothetical protein BGLA2_2480004 [Burkholderia gladioli]|nr:hypothetical protein BGLA2_2480004 [Burkholderia gladioli]
MDSPRSKIRSKPENLLPSPPGNLIERLMQVASRIAARR